MKKHFHIHIKPRAGLLTKIGGDPYADWFVILLISTIGAITLIYFSVHMFLFITDEKARLAADVGGTSAAATLNRVDLVKLIADFQDKKARTTQFQNGYQGAPDPSATSTFSR